MERLVFIDDDEAELKSVKRLVAGAYEYVPLHWPRQKPTEEFIGEPPAIFVSDLYLPPGDQGDGPIDYPEKVRKMHAARADRMYGHVPRPFPFA